jgi:hypothetical protein
MGKVGPVQKGYEEGGKDATSQVAKMGRPSPERVEREGREMHWDGG